MSDASSPTPVPGEPATDVTRLLLEWRRGDDDALDELTPLVYGELRRLAHAYMRRERPAHLLQTTALVHEAFLRLVGLDVHWEGRSHFFGICAQLMRRILVDDARRRRAAKRGGATPLVRFGDLGGGIEIAAERSESLIALDDALKDLESLDQRKAQVLEMKYFGGMSAPEIAEALDVAVRTVERDLTLARSWMADALGSS